PRPSAAPPSAPNAKPSKASNAIFIRSLCPETALWCVTAGATRFNGAGKYPDVIPGRIEDANLRCAIAHRGISRFSGAQLRTIVRFAPRNDGRIKSLLLETILRHIPTRAVIFVRQEFSGHRDLDAVALGIGQELH